MTCSNSSVICSPQFPMTNVIQKVYYLSQKDAISLVIEATLDQKLNVHIKLQNLETQHYVCLDPILLRELTMELRQLTKPNIDYPCIKRERQISVKPVYQDNEFRIKIGSVNISLASASVYELLNVENKLISASAAKNYQAICHRVSSLRHVFVINSERKIVFKSGLYRINFKSFFHFENGRI